MYLRTLAAGLLGVGVGIAVGYVVGKECRPAAPAPAPAVAPGDPRPGEAAPSAARPSEARLEGLERENAALKAQVLTLRSQLARSHAAPGGVGRRPAGLPGAEPAPGLLSPDEARALAASAPALLAELRKALEGKDQPRQAYLRSLLWQYLGAEPTSRAHELLEFLRGEKSPEMLEVLGGCLLENDAVRALPEVRSAFLALAESGEDPVRRRMGLDFISRSDLRPGDLQELLVRRAQGEPDRDLRSMAYQILAAPASGLEDDARAKVHERILGLLKAEREPQVRAEALLALDLAHAAEPLAKAVLEVLRSDADENVRAAAAESISVTRGIPRPQLLADLEGAYGSDRSEVAQRSLLAALVRAGGAEAVSNLERMAHIAGPIQKDVAVYLEVMKSGVTDYEEIEERVAQRQGGGEALPGSH